MEKTKKVNSGKGIGKKICLCLFTFLGVFAVLFLGLYYAAGTVFYNYALNATFAASAATPSKMAVNLPPPRRDDEWFEEMDKQLVEISSADGYLLKGYLIENKSKNYVLLFHGYRGNSSEMSQYMHEYWNQGFNVLAPDLKGHGQSEGKNIGMGYLDRLDALRWIDFVLEREPEAKIVLHGVSMGGATVMATTGESLPSGVVCAVEDCGFSSVYEQFDYIISKVLHLPLKNFIMTSSTMAVAEKLGTDLKQMDITKLLEKSKTPTLFIHGTADNFVPFYMLDKVYSSCAAYKEKLIVPGAAHAYSATKSPKFYFNKVFEFVDKFI